MEYIEKLISKLSLSNYDVGSDHWVDVTHINTPHSFYVRPTLCRRYMPVINAYDDDMPLMASEIAVGSTIIYKSEMLQTEVRGRVLFVHNEEAKDVICHVFAVDYGCYEKCISVEDIYKPMYSKDVPPLAINCQLADVTPHLCYWTKDIIEDMKKFIGNEQVNLYVREKSPRWLTVDLFNSCPYDISNMLACEGHTTHGYDPSKFNRYKPKETTREYYSFKKYKIGDVLNVQVLSGETLKGFYVAELGVYGQYIQDREALTRYCNKKGGFFPDDVLKGLAVATETPLKKFERSLIKELKMDIQTVGVILVDTGKFMEVLFSKLRPMAERHYRKPPVAIYCSADENQAWDNGLSKFLFPGYVFSITIEKLGDKFDTPHVVRIKPLLKN